MPKPPQQPTFSGSPKPAFIPYPTVVHNVGGISVIVHTEERYPTGNYHLTIRTYGNPPNVLVFCASSTSLQNAIDAHLAIVEWLVRHQTQSLNEIAINLFREAGGIIA